MKEINDAHKNNKIRENVVLQVQSFTTPSLVAKGFLWKNKLKLVKINKYNYS